MPFVIKSRASHRGLSAGVDVVVGVIAGRALALGNYRETYRNLGKTDMPLESNHMTTPTLVARTGSQVLTYARTWAQGKTLLG